MFESRLKDLFKKIFDFNRVSYDDPGETLEQECLFIQIDQCHSGIKDGRAVFRAEGQAFVYAQASKLPFGYFTKRIKQSELSDTADLFFHDIDANLKVIGNIVRRSFNFVFFYDEQFDPRQGSMTSVDIEVQA